MNHSVRRGPSRPSLLPGRIVLLSHRPFETRALGRRLGRHLEGNEIIALSGPLGSGKTCLAQGLGRGLGIAQPINSPSFVLMKRYRGRRQLTHWDWYRLNAMADLESSGFGDPQIESGVIIIEWAEKFLDCLEQPFLHIEIALGGGNTRRMVLAVRGRSVRFRRLLREIEAWWKARQKNGKTDTNPGH